MPIYKSSKKKEGKQGYRVVVNYTDHNGEYKTVERVAYGSTEAKEKEAELLQEYATGKTATVKRLTVAELSKEYLESKKSETRTSTHQKNIDILNNHILPYFSGVRADKLTPSKLQEWKNKLSEKGFAIHHLQNIYGTFRAILNYAVRMKYLSENPLLAVGNFKDTDFTPAKDKLKYYTPEQFVKFMSAAKEYAEKENSVAAWGYYVFFAIAWYMGFRPGENNALRWSRFDGTYLSVKSSINQKTKGNGYVETLPKNKTSYRTVKAPEPLIEILNEHRARQQINSAWNEEFFICGGDKCLPNATIDKRNREFATVAKLPHIAVYDFRHSFASYLANEGINIQEIARRMGHSNVKRTWETYAHLYPREEDRATSILDRVKI